MIDLLAQPERVERLLRQPGKTRSGPSLTARAKQVLVFIACHIREQGWAPTTREISAHLGVKSSSDGQQYVDALTEGGYLAPRPRYQPRALRLTELGRKVIEQEENVCPCCGHALS